MENKMKNRFCFCLFALFLLALCQSSWGDDQTTQVQVTSSNTMPASNPSTDMTPTPTPASPTSPQSPLPASTNPCNEILTEVPLVLAGIKDNGLNSTDATLQFLLTSSTFGTNAGPPELTINGTPVGEASMKVNHNQILIRVRLADGRNDLALDAYDECGRPLYMEKTIWAGSNKLQVDVVDDSGARVTGNVELKLKLTDDSEVTETLGSTEGQAVFTNVPSRPVIVEARSSDNGGGAEAGSGRDGYIQVRMLKFNKPSQVDNNDFSQGLAGWVGNGHVTFVPHVEDVGPGHSSHANVRTGEAPAPFCAPPVSKNDGICKGGDGVEPHRRTTVP